MEHYSFILDTKSLSKKRLRLLPLEPEPQIEINFALLCMKTT